jgi:carbonic anhydrase
MIDRRAFLISASAGVAFAAAGDTALAAGTGTTHTANTALAELMAGNARFVADKASCPPLTARRIELTDGQAPFVTILGCSDSRVPLETVFDQAPGNVFVVRNAGNFAESAGIGTIEYGIAALKSPLLLVLGHTECGAVKAAMAFNKDATRQPGSIQFVVDHIAPGIGKAGTVTGAVIANVRAQMAAVKMKSKIVSDALANGTLTIAGGYYDLHTGKVTLLE